MKRLAALCSTFGLVAVLGVAPISEAGLISFDTTPGGAGGTITYAGGPAPAVGTGIVFVDIVGIETPQNAGKLLPCVACTLSFTTGPNDVSGPPDWSWDGGGSFVLQGGVPGAISANFPTGIPTGSDLLVGSFVELGQTPGLAGNLPSALFLAVGVDEKHQGLLDFYGETNPFNFANTEIALGTFTITNLFTGAFTATPNQADINNASVPQMPAPAPAALLLIVLGLLAFPLVGRRFA